MQPRNTVGVFQESGAALAAAGQLREAGYSGLDLISPIPLHGADEVLGKRPSAIKRFTFFGAIFGGLSGFALAAGTAVLYLHPTGGRAIIPLPPYLIITYEMTILCGIIATVLGFLVSARLPVIRDRVYEAQASVDKFVVAVSCDSAEHAERAAAILSAAGADHVGAASSREGAE